MFSPDNADKDPRNPMNQDMPVATKWYIDPNQFSDSEISHAIGYAHDYDNEHNARWNAYHLAKTFHKTIVVDVGDEDGWFDTIDVKSSYQGK